MTLILVSCSISSSGRLKISKKWRKNTERKSNLWFVIHWLGNLNFFSGRNSIIAAFSRLMGIDKPKYVETVGFTVFTSPNYNLVSSRKKLSPLQKYI